MRTLQIIAVVSLIGCAGAAESEPEPAPPTVVVGDKAEPEAVRLSSRCNKDGAVDAYGRPADADRECRDTNPGTYTLR